MSVISRITRRHFLQTTGSVAAATPWLRLRPMSRSLLETLSPAEHEDTPLQRQHLEPLLQLRDDHFEEDIEQVSELEEVWCAALKV